MSVDWLFNLPVGDLAAPDAGLALWAYGPILPAAFELIERWGFDYKSDLFTWVKTTARLPSAWVT
jgi:N6-adenosine-specific RNA methylase IME4